MIANVMLCNFISILSSITDDLADMYKLSLKYLDFFSNFGPYGHSRDFLQLLNIIRISNSILIRSSSNVMGNQGRNLFFRQECSEFLETVGGPYLMGPRHDESCAKNESTLGVTFFFSLSFF